MTTAPHPTDDVLRDILTTTRTIAVVGASANAQRPSFGVLQYLLRSGYAVVAINPGLPPDAIAGVKTYPTLADVPVPIDMVDVFRNSDAAGAVVDEALRLDPLPKTIWMQLGVFNEAAAARAEARGVRVVMNRCPAIDRPRLVG